MELNPDQKIEISHDVLASEVYARINADEKMRLKITHFVRDRYEYYLEANTLLDKTALAYIEPYLDKVELEPAQTNFIRESREEIRIKERKRLIRILVIGGVLVLATIISVVFAIYASHKEQEAEAAKIRAETLLAQLGINQDFTSSTADALKKSKNDKTGAFVNLMNSVNKADSTIKTDLALEIKRNLLSEFSLYPFYKHDPTQSIQKDVKKIIAGDSLKYLFGLVHESHRVKFFNLNYQNPQLAGSLRPKTLLFSENSKYGNVNDIAAIDNGRKLISFHENGKIWEWSLDEEEPRFIASLDTTSYNSFQCMTPFMDGLLVAVDSIVYQVNLKNPAKHPPEFKIGFDRAVKLLVANPDNSGYYAVVKENSNQIIMCHANSIGKIPVPPEQFLNLRIPIPKQDTTISIQAPEQNTTVKSKPYIFQPDPEPVTCLAFSPDGKTMIAGFEGDIAKSWTLKRPDIITEFRGHGSLISCVAFSPDGETILTGSWDQTAILWKRSGEIIKRLVGHTNRITSIAYTHKGDAVTCSYGDDIKYWTVAPLSKFHHSFDNRILALAVSPTRNEVAFSVLGDEGFFYLWKWGEPGKEKLDTIWQPLKYKGDQKGQITSLAFSKDGKSILAASRNTRLVTLIGLPYLPDKKSLEDYRSGSNDKIPPTDGISCIDISEDYILIGNKGTDKISSKGRIKVSDNHMVLLRGRKSSSKAFVKLAHPSGVNAARFSNDGKYVITACNDGKAYLWDINKPKAAVDTLSAHASRISSVAFSSDEKYLLTGSADNTAILWKKGQGQDNIEKYSPFRRLEGITDRYSGHTSDVYVVNFANTSDSKFISASADKTVKIWELNKSEGLEGRPSIIRHLEEIRHARFSWDDKYILTGSNDGTIRVWTNEDAETVVRERVLGKIADGQ